MVDKKENAAALIARRMLLVAPAAAGLAVGVLAVEALGFRDLAWRFWHGAQIDPEGPSAPVRVGVIVAAVAAALGLWVLTARLFGGGRPRAESLRRYAVPFIPFLSILVLYAADVYGFIPGVMLFSVHALVFSVAAFAAVVAGFEAAGRGEEAHPAVRLLEKRALLVVAVAAGVYWLVFSAMGILQYYSLNISYTDTADWEQMLWNTMRGRFLETTAFDHMFFGEHVQFVHLLLLPFYALFPSLVTLMVLKSAALASGAFPVYLLARGRLGSKAAAALLAGAYLLYPGMQWVDLEMVYNTFRPVAFAIPALLWAVYFLDRRRPGAFAAAAFIALASKEEMALPVAMMGVLLLIERQWRWGGAVLGFSALWFAASVGLVIPYFRGGESHMVRYYADFGENLTFSGLLVEIISQPLRALGVAFKPVKIDYLLLLTVPLGLCVLFSWRMMLVMLPSLATTLLASRDPSYRIHFHYQAALVPLFVAGAVYGVENCTRLLRRLLVRFWGLEIETARRCALGGLAVLVFASAVLGNVLFAQSPISLLFHNPNMQTYWRNRYVPDGHSRLFFEEVRPLVEPEASVSATEFLATYFAARREDFVFPRGVGEAEYVVIDLRDRWLAPSLAERGATVGSVMGGAPYEKIYDEDGFMVYVKSAAGQT